MSKVDIEKLRLSMTALTEKIYVGLPEKDNKSFKVKHEVTNDFINAVIDWCGGYKRTITAGDKKWEITVKEIKS